METSTRTFEVPANDGTTLLLRIHEDVTIRADKLNLETWGSSLVLARRLHAIKMPNLTPTTSSSPNYPHRCTSSPTQVLCGPVLEIGAGTGLVGLSAAAVWKTNVTLTDLSPVVTALASNITLNRDLLTSSGGSASSGALDWRHPSDLCLYDPSRGPREDPAWSNKISVILAADTIYDSSHPKMLVNVIKTWLKWGPDSRVLIAYPVRVAYLEEIRELWGRMEGVGMEVLEEGKEELPKNDWDDEVLIEWVVWKWKEQK